jgi:hypothetical protein
MSPSDPEILIGPRRSGANECSECSLPGRTAQVDAIFEADNIDFLKIPIFILFNGARQRMQRGG